jgi:hypothetical protein
MINWNEQITREQALYIMEEVFPKAGYRIDAKTLEWWRNAHNFAFKEQVGIPGCSCEYIQTYNVWNSRLSQYYDKIKDIAYPEVLEVTPSGSKGYVKKGRKPKTSASSSISGEHMSDPNDKW